MWRPGRTTVSYREWMRLPLLVAAPPRCVKSLALSSAGSQRLSPQRPQRSQRKAERKDQEDLPPTTRYLLPFPFLFRRLARAESRALRRSPASRKRRRSSCVLRITGGTGLGLPISSRATNVRKAVGVCFRSPLL